MNEYEEKLIKMAVKGDVNAFEKIVYTYEKKIYNIAYNMFTNEQDAYDATQEVFIKLYRNIHSFKFDSSFATWLHRIAVNTCIDEYRKKKKHIYQTAYSLDEPIENEDSAVVREIKDQSKTPEDKIIQNETIEDVRKAISQLKEEYKSIIILRDLNGYSYEEIAKILDCSLGTIKSRLSRARNALKNKVLNIEEQKT